MELEISHHESHGSGDAARDRLNTIIAITIVLLVTITGVYKVKDKNIVLAMQEAQANKIDSWSWYQARNIREEVLSATASSLEASAKAQPAAGSVFMEQAKAFRKQAGDQRSKKDKLQKEATGYQDKYEQLLFRNDQFDLAEAALSIAVAMLAVTAILHKKWLYYLALAPAVFGVIVGLSGFFGWGFRPETLAKIIGA